MSNNLEDALWCISVCGIVMALAVGICFVAHLLADPPSPQPVVITNPTTEIRCTLDSNQILRIAGRMIPASE